MALGKLVNLCSVQLHFGKTLAAVPSGKVVGINFATPFIGYLALSLLFAMWLKVSSARPTR